MQELIKVEINERQEPFVSGRQLHEFLEVETPYHKWFPRMTEYGFAENIDFSVMDNFVRDETSFSGERKITDHAIKIDMAKELCMIQRTERGKQARKYFIEVEKEFNSPERIMARALIIAEKQIETLKLDNKVKEQQIAELQPKATYYDLILQTPTLLSVTEIAKDYGMSAKKLNQILHDEKVQFKQSGMWLLYAKYQDKGYTKTKTKNYSRPDGTQGSSLHTYWTQAGRLFIYDLLKKQGFLPVMEME